MPRMVFRRQKATPPPPPPPPPPQSDPLAPRPEEMLFVTLSQPSEPSSFKYRTALSEQWKKIGPIKGTIDFLLTNNYNFSKNHREVMSWNILGPGGAADGFAAKLKTNEENIELESVTNKFKTALDNVDKDDQKSLKTEQKYAIYAHYIVLGEKWRHYANGTFALNRNDENGPEKDGELKLNLSPQMYSERLKLLSRTAAGSVPSAAARAEKIEGWVNGRKKKAFISSEYILANKAVALMLGWDGRGLAPDDLVESDEGKRMVAVYTALGKATALLQLGKLDKRWAAMKSYMGMNPPSVVNLREGELAPPDCNVWCLQEMDDYCLKYLRKEGSINWYGFGGETKGGSTDCVVAWRDAIWWRPGIDYKELDKWTIHLINTVEKLTTKEGPSAAVLLKKRRGADTCIFVSVHLKSGTEKDDLAQRITELSNLSNILVSMVGEEADQPSPSIFIGMDANDPRGDILLRKALAVAMEAMGRIDNPGDLKIEVETELKKFCRNYDGGKSTESGAFGDGLIKNTPWLPNFEIARGPVVPSDHRYVMADPDRRFVLKVGKPLGNFDSVKNPESDFEAAKEKELAAAAAAPAPVRPV